MWAKSGSPQYKMHSKLHSGVDMFISDSAQLSPNPFKNSPGFKCLIIRTKTCSHNKTQPCGKENSATWSASPMFRLPLSRAGREQMYLNLTHCVPFLLNIKSRVYACCYFRYNKTPGEALCSTRRDTIWFKRCKCFTSRYGCIEKLSSWYTELASGLNLFFYLVSHFFLQSKGKKYLKNDKNLQEIIECVPSW